MPDGPASNVILADLIDLERRHHPYRPPLMFKRVLHGERIEHGRQHTHVITGGALQSLAGRLRTPNEISAAYHQANLHARVAQFGDFLGETPDDDGIDAASLLAHQGFAAQFQKDARVFG